MTVGGRDLVVKSRRRGAHTQAPPLLKARDTMLHLRHNLDVDALQSRRDRASMLNNRPLFADIFRAIIFIIIVMHVFKFEFLI